MRKSTLHFVVPGLLGPWVRAMAGTQTDRSLRSLQRLLTRARVSDSVGDEFTLTAREVGLDDAPVGAVSALGDGLEVGDAVWFCADPVNFVPDIHHLLLSDPRRLAITADDRSALRREILGSGLLDGMTLVAGRSGRWYLKLDTLPAVSTHAPYAAVGKDVAPWLPSGPWAAEWMARLTELQMLLHQSEFNQRREAAGKLPVNSIWLWGNGRCPPRQSGCVSPIFADGPFARGLGILAGAQVQAQPAGWKALRDVWEANSPAVVVVDGLRLLAQLDDPTEAMTVADGMERDWFAPIAQSMARSAHFDVAILPADGRLFQIDCWTGRRFWRRGHLMTLIH